MAGITADTYPIARPTGVCAQTGAPIAPGDLYIATLVEREGAEGLDRADYSMRAWGNGARPARLFGFWRAVMSVASEKRRMFIDDSELVSLFDQFEGAEDEKRIVFRYLLALVLLRKRLLRHVGSATRRGVRVMLVHPRGAPAHAPAIEVIDPAMNEGAILEAADQLTLVLRGES